MPLTGKAKKEYQRDYMRRRRQGLTKKDVRPVRPTVQTPDKTDLKAKLAKVGLKLDGNRISLAPPSTRSPLETESNSRLLLYNPRVHKTGDMVRMVGPTGKPIEIEVPELDVDGNQLW